MYLLDETYELHNIPMEKLDHHGFPNNAKEVVRLRVDGEIYEDMVALFGNESLVPDGDRHYIVTTQLPVEETTARLLSRIL